jgi:hypothetical protein
VQQDSQLEGAQVTLEQFHQAILRLEPRAIMRLQDIIRSHQGTYRDFLDRIGVIFSTAGMQPPEPSEIEHALIEAEMGD